MRRNDRRLGLLDVLDRAIPDPRDPGAITHSQRTICWRLRLSWGRKVPSSNPLAIP